MRRIGCAIALSGLLAACRPRASLAPPVVDGAQQAITAAVVSIERGETVVIDGQSLASTVVLADFYRRRGFRLAWTDVAVTDELLRAVRDSADDGLEPGDYHLTAIERLRAPAPSTPEARARLDLLLTDIALPHMRGTELAATLTSAYPQIRVLYMSGYSEERVPLGGSSFIPKPFRRDALIRKVREVLDSPD